MNNPVVGHTIFFLVMVLVSWDSNRKGWRRLSILTSLIAAMNAFSAVMHWWGA